ncbi:MAG: hypothetical protein ACD_35C00052G0001, partial [uncultured bacterium]
MIISQTRNPIIKFYFTVSLGGINYKITIYFLYFSYNFTNKYRFYGGYVQKLSLTFKILSIVVVLFLAISLLPVITVQAAANPISLKDFSATLKKSNSSQLAGVFVNDILALSVVQQASTYSVSSKSGTVTQFGLASKYGSIGLLAHNYLSGSSFSKLTTGTEIILIFGDGSTKKYVVDTIKKYQSLSPADPFSNFINLDKPDTTISSDDVINETYGSGDLVLQTCIKKNGVLAWGRLFIIASQV